MKQPQDHLPKKKTAAQREAEAAETVTLPWRDLEFTIPASADSLPVEFMEHAEEGKATKVVATVLGPRQFRAFKATAPTVGDFKELSDQIAEVYGFLDAGE